ncbi:hypothetical protein [Tepidimonas sp.]|uniref:hypothetical protein n=1 Tax=Tepidimonas sp. TaxID=2002775 RepID=UPI0028CC0ECA|nr:hypothetical protein [Tepidimonas sp.]MDT7929445.1 hypothetical protein [Tepidimonas sp.]
MPLTQEALTLRGHAIEARICAENPDNQFLPATGRLAVYRKPACSASFAQAHLDTALIEREQAVLFGVSTLTREAAVAIAVAHTLQGWQAQADADPWSAGDGFASHGVRTRTLTFRWGDESLDAQLSWPRGGGCVLRIGDGEAALEGPLH